MSCWPRIPSLSGAWVKNPFEQPRLWGTSPIEPTSAAVGIPAAVPGERMPRQPPRRPHLCPVIAVELEAPKDPRQERDERQLAVVRAFGGVTGRP
jgi:hypothetical protein